MTKRGEFGGVFLGARDRALSHGLAGLALGQYTGVSFEPQRFAEVA